jgi:hypothetical protein
LSQRIPRINNQFIPFKFKSNGQLNCHNGSTCSEPKLFNWLITNKIIEKNKQDNIFGSFNLGYALKDIDANKTHSSYSIYTDTKSTDVHKKLYMLGYFLYILQNYSSASYDDTIRANDLFYEISEHSDLKLPFILLDLMLPCQGCKMNYRNIITNDFGEAWSPKFCEKQISENKKGGGSINNSRKQKNNRKISKKKTNKTSRNKIVNIKKVSMNSFLNNKTRQSKKHSKAQLKRHSKKI